MSLCSLLHPLVRTPHLLPGWVCVSQRAACSRTHWSRLECLTLLKTCPAAAVLGCLHFWRLDRLVFLVCKRRAENWCVDTQECMAVSPEWPLLFWEGGLHPLVLCATPRVLKSCTQFCRCATASMGFSDCLLLSTPTNSSCSPQQRSFRWLPAQTQLTVRLAATFRRCPAAPRQTPASNTGRGWFGLPAKHGACCCTGLQLWSAGHILHLPSSCVRTSVALGGITPPAPLSPSARTTPQQQA